MRNRLARLAGLLLAFVAPLTLAAVPLVKPISSPAKSAKVEGQERTAVRFNAAELFALSSGEEVVLALPDGASVAFTYERQVDHGGGLRTWVARGKDTGDQERAVITSSPAGAWGWMRTNQGEYRLYPADGHEWLSRKQREIIIPRFPGGDAVEVPEDAPLIQADRGVPTFVPEEDQAKSQSAKVAPSPSVVADVMILYSDDLGNKLGAGLMPMLYNLIASSNQAYVDSEVAIQLRLVNATRVDVANSVGSRDVLFSMAGSPSGSIASFFQSLTWGSGSLRDQVGADFVAFVRDGPNDTGGIAFILKNPTPGVINLDNAYSVNNFCGRGCENIFAHEIGHNMGNAHDRATVVAIDRGQPETAGVFSYSLGHFSCINGLVCDPAAGATCTGSPSCKTPTNPNDFGTIMSYVNPTVMKFSSSSPTITCNPTNGTPPGRACGNAEADNARSMNEVRTNVSAYRSTVIAALPGSIQFKAGGYAGTEAGGTITFQVSRVGGTAGAVTVNYSAVGGTATAGSDFTAATGTLAWTNGDGTDKTITIPVNADAVTEGAESIVVTLSSPAGAPGVYLGYPATAIGLISDGWPPGGTIPSGFAATSGAAWSVATDFAFDGDGRSLKSGAINFDPAALSCDAAGTPVSSGGTRPCPSSVTFTGNLGAGTIAFAYRVDSYPSFGFFEFLIDGAVVLSASGDPASVIDDPARPGWRVFSTPVSAGSRTLTWRYRTSLTFACQFSNPPQGSSCADRAWIDAVSLPTAGGAAFDANVRAVVTSYYQTILGRAPDAAGLDFWVAEANRMVLLGADVREVFYSMAIQFFSSPEYTNRGTSNDQFIRDLYQTFFSRAPDQAGLDYWKGELNAVLSRSALLNSFLFSTEFSNTMTGLFGNTAVRPEVNLTMDFFRGVVGRLPDNSGFVFWRDQLRAAQCAGGNAVNTKVTEVANAFFGAPEYGQRSRNNPDFMGDVYNTYLRRGPGGDAPGFNFWVSEVVRTNRDTVRGAFVPSAEFQGRVTAIVGAGCLPS